MIGEQKNQQKEEGEKRRRETRKKYELKQKLTSYMQTVTSRINEQCKNETQIRVFIDIEVRK